MKKTFPDLSQEQWKFLTVIKLLGGTMAIDVLDSLAPLTASQLVDLLQKTSESGLLQQTGDGRFSLGTTLPEDFMNKIRENISKKKISELLNVIYAKNIDKTLDPQRLAELLGQAGKHIDAARLQFELAEKEMTDGKNFDNAQQYILDALVRLTGLNLDNRNKTLYISQTLKLSNLSYVLGRGLINLNEILKTAQEFSIQQGDKRSHALINLHIGRHYYLTGSRDDAFLALSAGLEEVNELGDEDILSQSAEFNALFHFMKGHLSEVMKHLEHYENIVGIDDMTPPLNFVLFSYSAIFLGQFHRAIGFLNANLHLAEEKRNKSLAAVFRSILGTALALLKKYHEAEFHLKRAQQNSLDTGNAIGYIYSSGGLALLYFMKDDLRRCHEILLDAIEKAEEAGIIQQFSSPWILEILYEFHRLNLKLPRWNFQDAEEVYLNGINIHLKGVVLRLKAQQKMDLEKTDWTSIKEDLDASRTYLELSGNPLQLAKTILETARMELLQGNKSVATDYSQEAWRLLGGYALDFFPKQYKNLLDKNQLAPGSEFTWGDYILRYFDELNFIRSSVDQEEALNKTILSTTRFFCAERGGLFWFSEGKYTKKPFLRAAGNLTKEEVTSLQFKPYLEYVLKAFRTNKPLVIRPDREESAKAVEVVRSVLCLPIAVHGATRCVLYLDNSYMPDAFGFLDPLALSLLGKHTSDMVDFLFSNMKIRNEKEKLSKERAMIQQDFSQLKLIAQSRIMKKLRSMVDQVAGTDTTILLLGETGTGKGVFARVVHENSKRQEGPFIVVDCATIPENLVESELFGYEKGSFTGADRQKFGRVELAHEGTLFLDEIGELPLHLQTKLLKAIEEKSFVRIGGGKPIRSDFRLIAATNRDLKDEVSKGLFREDLYYRLNIFPITMPPLRNREDDIIELAKYFIDLYSRQYERSGLKLTGKDTGILMNYTWPGNVRELQNVIERAVILSKDGELQIPLLTIGHQPEAKGTFDEMPTLDELQRQYIQHVFDYTKGKVGGPGGAAEVLGMKRTSLYARMRTLGMRK